MMRAATLAFLCAAAAACALAPFTGSEESRRAVMDAYLIAHGMAVSYGQERDADPAVTAELARLDRRAQAAVAGAAQGGDAESERAVAALSDYAARHGGASGPREP